MKSSKLRRHVVVIANRILYHEDRKLDFPHNKTSSFNPSSVSRALSFFSVRVARIGFPKGEALFDMTSDTCT